MLSAMLPVSIKMPTMYVYGPFGVVMNWNIPHDTERKKKAVGIMNWGEQRSVSLPKTGENATPTTILSIMTLEYMS